MIKFLMFLWIEVNMKIFKEFIKEDMVVGDLGGNFENIFIGIILGVVVNKGFE